MQATPFRLAAELAQSNRALDDASWLQSLHPALAMQELGEWGPTMQTVRSALSALAITLVWASPASAEWREISGRHFVVYSDDARHWFIAANKVDKEDPEPLTYYYRSYRQQGIAPSRNAVRALHYASSLMPQDEDVRMLSAIQYAFDDQIAEARQSLGLLTYNAHNSGEQGKMVQAMMAKLAAGDGKGAAAIADEAEKKAEAERKKK